MTRAANIDFFAAQSDQIALLQFLFASTDVRIFESYSEFGKTLREFSSASDLADAFPVGHDMHGNGHAILLQLWSPSAMRQPSITRISLKPEACNGHTFRYCIEGGGLMQLYFGGVSGAVLTKSHFGHQSQARALAWGSDDGVDWSSMQKTSNQIQYHLRKRLAVGKVRSCPVLAEAAQLAAKGYALKLAVQTPWQYEFRATENAQPSIQSDAASPRRLT